MDNLTLGQKLEYIEACEKLIKLYEASMGRSNEGPMFNAGNTGYGYTDAVAEKMKACQDLKATLVAELEKDVGLLQQNVYGMPDNTPKLF